MRKVADAVPRVQIVTFRLGPDDFGLDVFSVHEVLRYEPVTPVPHAPGFVEGVIEVRGALIPILDLRRRFELARVLTGPGTRIMIVSFGGERLGLIVDEVLAVHRVPESEVSAPPGYVRGIAAEFIRGIARIEGRLVILIEMDRVLSSDERIALEEADFGE